MSVEGPSTPRPIEQAKLLLGEGVEEVLFFGALLQHLNISQVQVENYRGKSNLGAYLRTLRARTGFASLSVVGVTRDADDDWRAAVASVEDSIANGQFPTTLTVRHFVLPAPGQAGSLEDLCFASFGDQPIEGCIRDYLDCVDRVTPRAPLTGSRLAKARVHAWLAAQSEPDLRLGHAAAKGLIEWSHPAFDELKRFLTDLLR